MLPRLPFSSPAVLFLTVLACSLFSLKTTAQNPLPIGSWRAHLPYKNGPWVTQSDRQIIYATEWSLLLLDKEELSTRFVSTVDGLSNAGISLIRYNRGSDILVVVYTNAVIDLVRFEDGRIDEIVTLNQIRNFTNLPGEKAIFDIFMQNDSVAYLAASYGVSKLNLLAEEFSFTTFTGIGVQSVAVHEGFLYAATAEGTYRVAESAPIPDDFGNWSLLGTESGYPPVYRTTALGIYNDELYTGIDDSLFVQRDGALQYIHHEPGLSIPFLSAEGDWLLVGYRATNGSFGRVARFGGGGVPALLPGDCTGRPNYAIEDGTGRVWIGDIGEDYRVLLKFGDNDCERLSFNSPLSEENRELTVYQDQLWLATGGVDQTFTARFIDEGFASLIDGQWTHYNRDTREALRGENTAPSFRDDDLFDFMTVRVNPANGKVYAGSFMEGLIEVDGETITLYNENNSTLRNAEGDATRTRVGGLAFDADNHLWIANHSAINGRPISRLSNEGEWTSFDCSQTALHQMDVDRNGFKWFVTSNSSAGVVLFDEGDPEDGSDDRCRVFTASNSELPTNSTNCLAVDLDGDVWVGTDDGVVIFECGGSAFEPECRGTRRIIEQDDFGAFLLEGENIRTIAVDGANRKWVGTRNGIFLLSPDGEEQIARFTETNSPLFDNNIIDIAVSDLNGEVFIGTNKGILSYQGETTLGGTVHRGEITVFPNPVRPEYDGPIAIRGLARDAVVKITDLNGKLVYETEALGGQAIWDGRDYNGRRANSGVYLVFSATNARNVGFNAKPTSAVAKVLFLN